MKAIYKRELQSYLQNMTGVVFIAFLCGFVGVYFMALNLSYGYPYFSYTLTSVIFILMIAIPLLTMRSFAAYLRSHFISSETASLYNVI